MFRLFLAVISLPVVVSFKCNYFDPAHEELVHYDHSRFKDFTKEIACPKLKKGGTQIYGCYSRVDDGVVSMGCHNTKGDEQESLCARALDSAKLECNYYPTTPMGAFHSKPGNGICCCVEGNGCNEAPPDWLVGPTRDYLKKSEWLKGLAHAGFLLTWFTIFTLVFMLMSLIHHYIQWAMSKCRKQPKSEKSQSEMTPEEDVEENSALGPDSSRVFSACEKGPTITTSAEPNKQQPPMRSPSATPNNLPTQTPPPVDSYFGLNETQKSTRPRTVVGKSQTAKSNRKGGWSARPPATSAKKAATPLVSAASPSRRQQMPEASNTQNSETQ